MSVAVVEIVEVPLKLVEEPSHVLRPVDRSTPKFLALVESMKGGFKRDEPIQVAKVGGAYVIQAKGMHRFNAASAAGLEKVWVAVLERELTAAELISSQVQAEATHTEARPAEFGRAVLAYMNLDENRGKTKVAIAKEMGRETGFIDKVLKLVSLPQDVQELIDDNEISMENGLALVALVRAGVALTPELLQHAKQERAADFQARAARAVQELRAAPRGRKEPPPRLRKVSDVHAELKRATLDKTVHPSYVAGLAYALRMDAVSAEAEGLAPAMTGEAAEGAALRAEAAKLRASLEAADVLAEAAKTRTAGLEREIERLNRELDQRDSVIKALEKGRKPEA